MKSFSAILLCIPILTKAHNYSRNRAQNNCNKGCTETLLNNSYCDSYCNTIECYFDNYDCQCVPGCTAEMVLDNNKCDNECNVESCNYDNGNCEKDKEPSYINLLTIIGFVVIGISFCLIFGVMVWYYKKRRVEMFQRIASSENTSRLNYQELLSKWPEFKCTSDLLTETCTICLDE